MRAPGLRGKLPQHVGQDAAVAEIFKLVQRIDPTDERDDIGPAVGAFDGKDFCVGGRKWGRPAVEVEQAVIDALEHVAGELRRYLRVFNGIVTIGPLLGLLGTVFGIIRAFNDIAASDTTGRMEMLSHGISEALFCTATGLSIAIPAVVMHLYFVSRVDRLVLQLDSLGRSR